MARKKLGELLLERRVITREQLEQALAHQRQTGYRLGTSLLALGFLTEDVLCQALAQALGLNAVTRLPGPDELDWSALHTLRARFCDTNDCFPLRVEPTSPRKTLVLAMADPLNIPAIEEIEFTANLRVQPVIAPLSKVRAAIRQHYLKQSDAGAGEIVRPGGAPIASSQPPQQAAPPRRIPTAELPMIEPEPIEEVREETTERTAVAELIRQRDLKRRQKAAQQAQLGDDLSYLLGETGGGSPTDSFEELESRFWALLRILAKKGLITREEFLKELGGEQK